MKTHEEIFNQLKEKFGESIIQLNTEAALDPYILVDSLEVDKICRYLAEENDLKFDNLMCFSGVDDANGENKKDENDNLNIEGGTLSVFYHLESTSIKHKITLRVSTPREKPEVSSVTDIWNSANWHEREAYDLIGITFLNHPDLRRILMPYDWDAGHPLRKDYKNPEYYQGMKVPY